MYLFRKSDTNLDRNMSASGRVAVFPEETKESITRFTSSGSKLSAGDLWYAFKRFLRADSISLAMGKRESLTGVDERPQRQTEPKCQLNLKVIHPSVDDAKVRDLALAERGYFRMANS